MNDNPEALMEALIAENDQVQLALRRRLNALVKRFASGNLQAMLDFDHLGNDGLDRHHGNVLSDTGRFTLLDRGKP